MELLFHTWEKTAVSWGKILDNLPCCKPDFKKQKRGLSIQLCPPTQKKLFTTLTIGMQVDTV